MEFPRNKHLRLPPDDIAEWHKLSFRISLWFPQNDGDPMAFRTWLANDTAGRFYQTHSHIYFEHEDDAIMYTLRWA